MADKYISKLVYFSPIAASILTLSGFYFFQQYFDAHVINILNNIEYFILGVCILVFPTSFISGMIFPLLGDSIHRKNLVVTSTVGYLTLANTIGAVIGSAVAAGMHLPADALTLGRFLQFVSCPAETGTLQLLPPRSRATPCPCRSPPSGGHPWPTCRRRCSHR